MYDIKPLEFGQKTEKLNTNPATKSNAIALTQTQTELQTKTPNERLPHLITTPSIAYLPHLSTNTAAPSNTAANLTNSTSSTTAYSICSVITPAKPKNATKTKSTKDLESGPYNPAERTHMTLLSLRRRRWFQRQACLLCILAAFIFGIALGVFVPMFGVSNIFYTISGGADESSSATHTRNNAHMHMLPIAPSDFLSNNDSKVDTAVRPPSDFPTIYEMHGADERLTASTTSSTSTSTSTAKSIEGGGGVESPFSVAFIKEPEVELSAEEVFRNAFHLEQDKHAADVLIVKKLDASDSSIKEFRVQRTPEGRFRKGPERKLSKPSLAEQILQHGATIDSLSSVPMAQRIVENARQQRDTGIIKSNIFWGDLVERTLPKGFGPQHGRDWQHYVSTQGIVDRLETGCGRMQNRLVVFKDGTRACARYRQNTDQIQGELFSYYLGQLLNISNLAPSAVAVVNTESPTWSSALDDLDEAQWKSQRPVVLTRWLSDLEPAGIPQPFQPLERHLNKYDVWNITLSAAAETNRGQSPRDGEEQSVLFKRLETANIAVGDHQSTLSASMARNPSANALPSAIVTTSSSATSVLRHLIELAQWSDLIVFDYLIANLDRVVNNLYNFQWNADIMAAPAHNLARQVHSQLLVFLDNESGLLHGYRLLKKYDAYHGLLLDNLCVFRESTIVALQQLRANGAGHKLRELFEQSTSAEVRDVLPPLPDKSITILRERIDHVLDQVQKCRELFANR